MEELELEFEQLKNKYEDKIKLLDGEFSKTNSLSILSELNEQYVLFIKDMTNLFEDHDYVVPYSLYKYFNDISCKKYDLLCEASESVKESGQLPAAFLKEATRDFTLLCTPTLLQLEEINHYFECEMRGYCSLISYDVILEKEMNFFDERRSGINFFDLCDDYVSAAQNLLIYLKRKFIEKAREYYDAAITLLCQNCDYFDFDSNDYYFYYIKLIEVLNAYQNSIKDLGSEGRSDIDEWIYDTNYEIYLKAQRKIRDKMIILFNESIKNQEYKDAILYAKKVINIGEEQVRFYKTSSYSKSELKTAYELYLSIPNIDKEDSNNIQEKLAELKTIMECDEMLRKYPKKPFYDL